MRELWASAFVLAVIVLGIWIGVERYSECREMGFSRFYCLTSR